MQLLTDPFSVSSLIVTSIAFMVIILVFAIGLATLLGVYEKRKSIKEKRELKEEIDNYLGLLQEYQGDVLALITRNLTLLREAYIICKQQVRNVFSTAIFVCCLGFIVFATGIIVFSSQGNIAILVCSTSAGTVIEIVAALIFWIYSKSLEQLNTFHKTFYENQKLVSSIHLIDGVSETNKDALYAYIVQNIIGNGSPVDFSLLVNSAKPRKTNLG
ncbi:MAG TPA: hypothetical protein V6D14_03020 [Coleofasciculaceae cyanobacterium]|jgi:hypothetical protein